MGDKTGISWTDATWNPVTGCTRISNGCVNCYAERQAKRLQRMGQANYVDGFAVRCHENMLDQPSRWRRPRKIFVCSMGDLFHDEVPDEFIHAVYRNMLYTPRHIFQVLTKRPDRMKAWLGNAVFDPSIFGDANMDHIWHGVSVENFAATERINVLCDTPVPNRFISFEPFIEPLIPLMPRFPTAEGHRVHWIIVGGESGPGARPMDLMFAKQLVQMSANQGVKVFFKQMGSVWAKENSKTRKGDDPSEWPEWARVQEFPWGS